MSTVAFPNQPLVNHRTSTAAPKAQTAAAPRTPTYAEADARATRMIVAAAGAASLIILVFFLAMMWWLSGYGPVA